MQKSLLTTLVLPIALAIIMLGMGLSLVLADVKRVAKHPKAVAIGIACQMLLLPLVGYGVISLIKMDSPELAVGLMILTFCPGGATSNMFTFLARGDVALSITLTAVVSAIAPFTIPLLTTAAMSALMGKGQALAMGYMDAAGKLLVITVIPVAIGMAIKAKAPQFAQKSEKPVKILSLFFLLAIIAALIKKNWAMLPSFFVQTGVSTLLLNITTMAVGFGIARAAKLGREQQITIGMEVGIQNGTTALLVAGTLLDNPTMTIAPAIYSLLMFVTGGLFGMLMNAGRKKSDSDGATEQAQT